MSPDSHQYQEQFPGSVLEPYVERYYQLDVTLPAGAPRLRHKVLPNGFVELVFHAGDPVTVSGGGGNVTFSGGAIAGQLQRHVVLETGREAHSFGIRLKPAGLHHLLGLPADQLTDRICRLDQVLEGSLRDLESRLLGLPSFDGRVELAEAILGEQLRQRREEYHYIFSATDWIAEHDGQVRLPELERRIGYSERQLERNFKQKVGVSPKFFIRIQRLNYAFRLLQQKLVSSWADLAYACGFSDQAHFVREFKGFAGESPTSFFATRSILTDIFQGLEVGRPRPALQN